MVTLHRAPLHIHRPKTVVAAIGTNRRVPNRVSACMLDVAIVGAGPAGLCTAAALTRGSVNPSAIQVSFMITHMQWLRVLHTCTSTCVKQSGDKLHRMYPES